MSVANRLREAVRSQTAHANRNDQTGFHVLPKNDDTGFAPRRETTRVPPSSAVDVANVDAWLIDLDNTLYPATVDLFPQFDARVGQYISRLLGVGPDEAARLQIKIWNEYGNSLRGLMSMYDCAPLDFIEFIHDIDLTSIDASPLLDQALRRLPGRKLIFTNGSAAHAERVMARMGVAHHFEAIFDIVASGFATKPETVVYRDIVKRFGLQPARTMMVDDVAANLEPAHRLGMRTVWVRSRAVDSPLPTSGNRQDFVHHETDDLLGFLQQALDL